MPKCTKVNISEFYSESRSKQMMNVNRLDVRPNLL